MKYKAKNNSLSRGINYALFGGLNGISYYLQSKLNGKDSRKKFVKHI